MEELRRTPLNEFHRAHGARMVAFAGWEMPLQYGSILDEHRAVRERAGLFDVSHMGEIEVSGREAAAYLQSVATNDIGKLMSGKALYSLLCREDGGVVDDILIYQLANERYLLCVNAANTASDVAWLQSQQGGYECRIEDVSAQWAQLALQGPAALAVLKDAGATAGRALRRFEFCSDTVADIAVLVSRTGYTGEDGVELYIPAADALRVATAIHAAGQAHGMELVGLGARDSLRLEAGYPLYGHEISAVIDPLTAGLGWAVKLDKALGFVGHAALAAKKAAGPVQRVRFFVINDRRIARAGTAVLDADGNARGQVLSGTLSPMLNLAIGSALVDVAALDAPGHLYVDVRGCVLQLNWARPPLHQFSLNG